MKRFYLPEEYEMVPFETLLNQARKERDRCVRRIRRYQERINASKGKGYTKEHLDFYDNMYHLQEQLDYYIHYIEYMLEMKSKLN